MSIGLSREHDWAAGTLSLSIASFTSLLRDMARDIARSVPTRNLAIINGHGGNRGLLDNLMHELQADFGLNVCAVHPFDLVEIENLPTRPDVHGGRSETSVMLALAPHLVRRDLLARSDRVGDSAPVKELIFDRGASFPWRTDDPRLAVQGVIGDARAASAEFGNAIIDGVVEGARGVLRRLLDNQKVMAAAAAKSRRG
jgi:creatinine amidohydrolase/Fe(II)-dependent formamide hydrolase-like protein